MKQQMAFFLVLTLIAGILVATFAVWRINVFDENRAHLLEASERLQVSLDENFNRIRAIGQLRTHLRMFINSAAPENMLLLRKDLDLLGGTLSQDLQDDLDEFQKMLDELEVRMASLRKNSQITYQAESNIIAAVSRLLKAVDPDYFFMFQTLTIQTCLEHHRLYVSAIQAGQSDAINRDLRSEEELFARIDVALQNLARKFPPNIQELIEDLRNFYYDLDESVATVAAIRMHTLESQGQVSELLHRMEENIAASSLEKHRSSQQLMARNLLLARKNITIMYGSLLFAALTFTLVAFLLNRFLINPLVQFVTLLQKVTAMLAGLRTSTVIEDAEFIQLCNMASTQKNEIGEVAHSIEHLVKRLRALALYRQAIEGDETSADILRRLGNVFCDQLGLESFAIYEKIPEKSGMHMVCVSPESMRERLPSTKEERSCRAGRIGITVPTMMRQSICDCNPIPGETESICMSMWIGGQVIGVIQFLPPVEMVREDKAGLDSRLEDAEHYIAETLPVLQSRQLAQKLECMATEDALTGLFNRRYLELSLDRISAVARRGGSPVGILMCDVDHFKAVNDEFGHDAGDEVLRQMSRIFSSCTRNTDLAVRYGGEEFLILLVDCKANDTEAMGERIREAVEKHGFRIPGRILRQTISIGAVEFLGRENLDIREAIKQADVALYRAKEGGRNQVVRGALGRREG